MKCNQETCSNDAVQCYRWPGHGLAGICDACAPKAQRIAEAMGFTVDFQPLEVLIAKQRDGAARASLAWELRRAAEALDRGDSFELVGAAVAEALVTAAGEVGNG